MAARVANSGKAMKKERRDCAWVYHAGKEYATKAQLSKEPRRAKYMFERRAGGAALPCVAAAGAAGAVDCAALFWRRAVESVVLAETGLGLGEAPAETESEAAGEGIDDAAGDGGAELGGTTFPESETVHPAGSPG